MATIVQPARRVLRRAPALPRCTMFGTGFGLVRGHAERRASLRLGVCPATIAGGFADITARHLFFFGASGMINTCPGLIVSFPPSWWKFASLILAAEARFR